ncbi:MAG: AAA domain-containing protein [Marinifilaceae bacterium]
MYNTQSQNWLKYYRNSLADAARMDISAKECEKGVFFKSFDELTPGALKKLFRKLSPKKKKEETPGKEKEIQEPVVVMIAPLYLKAEYIHAVKKSGATKIFPFWIPARLNEEGTLLPPDEKLQPWFIRGVLEPTAYKANVYPIISSVEKVDQILGDSCFCYDTWSEYLESSLVFFKRVTGQKHHSFNLDSYTYSHSLCLIKAKPNPIAVNVLALYDDLVQSEKRFKLLEQLLSFEKSNYNQIPDPDQLFATQGHYGQYNNEFPLSHSQRISLKLWDADPAGNVLAVNGPPGTGKTTLLQSVIANELVKSVLEGNQPPRIVASSSNNQAITNILDSFGGKLNRWIPDLSSLGTYMIANDKQKQKEATEKGYQILTRNDNKFNGHYISQFHDADIQELESFYIQKYSEYDTAAQTGNIAEITQVLRENIKEQANRIDSVLKAFSHCREAEREYFPRTELPVFRQSIIDLEVQLKQLSEYLQKLEEYFNCLVKFSQETKWLKRLSFIPLFKRKYNRKLAQLHLQAPNDTLKLELDPGKAQDWVVQESQEQIKYKISLSQKKEEKQRIYIYVAPIFQAWSEIEAALNQEWNAYLNPKDDKTRSAINKEFSEIEEIEQINRKLDVSCRYKAFTLALHYWEGMWLQEQKKSSFEITKGKKSRTELFLRLSHLTPLFISTFHSLPAFCSSIDPVADNWVQSPMYELFDILIVDEAGQVSPELGVPAFSLAKKALVVGDVEQIEPVWNIPYPRIDAGNLGLYNLLNGKNFHHWQQKKILCSSGSLMHIAQLASDYKVKEDLKGTLLTEHRRCVDELVTFSNEFVYDGLLRPMVGASKGKKLQKESHEKEAISLSLPPLSYMNVSGISEKRNGSTYNTREAETIAGFVDFWGDTIVRDHNKGKSEEKHKKLSDIIAIVTPFSAQKHEIRKQFQLKKIEDGITVGTVHALQGAEREIVIFSPAYGANHNGSLFFDSGFNMLNVALTRAKKHFIVMGNMSLFDPRQFRKPSGGLAKYLFQSPANEISSWLAYNEIKTKSTKRIDELEKHRGCIVAAFLRAKKRIIIVSPFISIHAINADEVIPRIQKAVAENIEVKIYSDAYLDCPGNHLKKSSKDGREALQKAGAELILLKGIHNKAIAVDEEILVEGSFNWLSAVRDTNHPHYRYEVSQLRKGKEAKIQIAELVNSLESISQVKQEVMN